VVSPGKSNIPADFHVYRYPWRSLRVKKWHKIFYFKIFIRFEVVKAHTFIGFGGQEEGILTASGKCCVSRHHYGSFSKSEQGEWSLTKTGHQTFRERSELHFQTPL
jgi:hypothetical protein